MPPRKKKHPGGRPRTLDGQTTESFVLESKHSTAVTEWARRNECSSRSAALRQIIEAATTRSEP